MPVSPWLRFSQSRRARFRRLLTAERLEDRCCPAPLPVRLDFQSPSTGSQETVSTTFGTTPVTVIRTDGKASFQVEQSADLTASRKSGLNLIGFWENEIVDPDLTAAGHGRTVFQSAPDSRSFGRAHIQLLGALGTQAQFRYGTRNEVSTLGFTAYAWTEAIKNVRLNGGDAQLYRPTPSAPDDVFYQFALGAGQPSGPAVVNGLGYQDSGTLKPGAGYFNEFVFTSGTHVGSGAKTADIYETTRPGASQVDDVTLSVLPVADLLRNAVTAAPNGATMRLFFQPKGPSGDVHLEDLARALDVDHFNWRQTLVDWPETWKMFTVDMYALSDELLNIVNGGPTLVNVQSSFDGTPKSVVHADGTTSPLNAQVLSRPRFNTATQMFEPTVFDPYVDPSNYRPRVILAKPPGDRYYPIVQSQPHVIPGMGKSVTYPDDYQYLYHEEGAVTGHWNAQNRRFYQRPNGTPSGFSFGMADVPFVPAGAFDGAQTPYLQFMTELVGVREDRSGVSWRGLGTNFTWKSNAVTTFDRISLITDPEAAPTISGGGIFDVFSDDPSRTNSAPVAGADGAAGRVDKPLVITVLANDRDTDYGFIDPGTVQVTASPTRGTVQVNGTNGTITYTPQAGFAGTDTFRYTVRDAQGAVSNEATVTVTVTPSGPPVAENDTAVTPQDTTVSIDVLANDTDINEDIDATTVTIVSVPEHGLATVNPTTGAIQYTPAISHVGPDRLTYRVRDREGAESNLATVLLTVSPAPGAVLEVSAGDAPFARNSLFNLGETRRSAGSLVRTLTLRNSGTAPLTFGTASASGAGYSVSQPSAATLAPGETASLTVTLSNTAPGLGQAGTVTLPTNDPAGPFVLNLRGSVDDRPLVVAVTRLDDPTGKLVVALDFSEPLQSGPANNVSNFALSLAGRGVPLASAVYSETGGKYRVTLTTTATGPFDHGAYDVRFDGAKIRSSFGTRAAEPRDRLLVEVGERNEYVTIGPRSDGTLGVDGGPTSLGDGPSPWIDRADFDGDGLLDLVTTSAVTSEVVIYYGRAEGGFGPARSFVVEAAAERDSRPGRAVAYDWDRNGTTDLVVWDNGTGVRGSYWTGAFPRVIVYLNDGHGRFLVAPDMPVVLPEYAMGSEGSLVVGPFGPNGTSGFAMNGPHGFTSDATRTAIAVYGKDPFVGYSEIAQLANGRTGWYPQQIVAADLNGDGRPDLIANTAGYYLHEPGLTVNLSTTTGHAAAIYPGDEALVDGQVTEALYSSAVVGDFTGDGKPDLIVLHRLRNADRPADMTRGYSVLTWNSAANRFVSLGFQTMMDVLILVGAADLNGDGRADVVALEGASVVARYSNGDGTFWRGTASPLAPSGNVHPGNFILQDFTGDGLPDAVFGNTQGGQIGFLTNDGTGRLRTNAPTGPSSGVYTLSAGTYDSRLATGDFNRDGLTDFVRVGNGVGVYVGNPSGGYTPASILASPAEFNQPAHWALAGDLNRDGNTDLLVGTVGESRAAQVWLGNGDATFRAGPDVALADESSGTRGALVDINGDGKLDYVGRLATPGSVDQFPGFAVWFGDGTGKLTYNANTRVLLSGVGEQFTALTPNVADVTGDGILDVIVRRIGDTPEVVVYPGRGNGTFAAPVTTPVTADPGLNFASLDFDRDGKTDLVGWQYTAWSGVAPMVLRGLGGGRFAEPVALPGDWSDRSPTRVVAGDFDHDGRPDLAVVAARAYPETPVTSVRVYRGDGAGGFTPETFAVGGETVPRHVGLTDDGPWSLSGIATATPLPGNTWVEAGTVTPPLPPAPPPPPGGQPLTVTTTQGQPVRVQPPSVPGVKQFLDVNTHPGHGTVRIDDNGTPLDLGDDAFIYAPAAGFVGTDTWTYLARNAGGRVSGTVQVTVQAPTSPVLSFSAATYSVGEAQGTREITVQRGGSTTEGVTVRYTVSDGTAVAFLDYQASSGTLTFAAGETSKTLTVFLIDDPDEESNETVLFTLSNPTGGATLGSPSSAVLTITDDDGAEPPPSAPAELRFSLSAYQVAETAGTAVITVQRLGSTAADVSVRYATADGTARAGQDYTAASGTLTVPAGALSAIFRISLLGDSLAEGEETVNLTLSDPLGAVLVSPSTAVLTINDALASDPYPSNLIVLANELTHDVEAYAYFIKEAYRLYLKRLPDDGGLAYWVDQMKYRGLSDERLEAHFLGSREYIANHGGTGAAWVIGMYQDLLGRTPDDVGLAYWTERLREGVSPLAIAYGFAASEERETQRITADYQLYLGRDLDPEGLRYWVDAFLRGAMNEDVVGGFVGSEEYYGSPMKGQSNRRQWVVSAFQDVFHRRASDEEIALWVSRMR